MPELPEGWCWTTVDSISAKVSDGVHKKPNYVDFGIPFITVKNLTCGPGISFEDTKFISEEDHAEFVKRTHPEKGDVLVTKDGATLGRVRLVETDRVFSIFVSVALIKLIDPTIASFIVQMLESPQGQEAMKVTGTGIQHIHLVDLRATIVPLPPSAEQKEIVRLVNTCLSGLLRINEDYENGSAHLTQLNQSILAKAFRGELVPQDPNDEPASELLARIRREREDSGKNAQATKGKSRMGIPARRSPAKRIAPANKNASTAAADQSLVIRVLAEGGAVNIHADTSGPTVQFYTKSSGGGLLAEIEDMPESALKPRESKRVANLSDLMDPDLALLHPVDVNETYLPQLRDWYTRAASQLPKHFENEFLEQAKSRWSEALQIEESSTSQSSTKAKRGRLLDS